MQTVPAIVKWPAKWSQTTALLAQSESVCDSWSMTLLFRVANGGFLAVVITAVKLLSESGWQMHFEQ